MLARRKGDALPSRLVGRHDAGSDSDGLRDRWRQARHETVVLRRAAALDERDGRPRVIGLLGQDAGAIRRALRDRPAGVTLGVPPLRHREHDMELLIAG